MGEKSPAKGVWEAAKPFFNGGLSGMGATCVIQPVDMVKVRLQLGAQGSPVRPSRWRPALPAHAGRGPVLLSSCLFL